VVSAVCTAASASAVLMSSLGRYLLLASHSYSDAKVPPAEYPLVCAFGVFSSECGVSSPPSSVQVYISLYEFFRSEAVLGSRSEMSRNGFAGEHPSMHVLRASTGVLTIKVLNVAYPEPLSNTLSCAKPPPPPLSLPLLHRCLLVHVHSCSPLYISSFVSHVVDV
jgi:hypothetical protein